MTESSVIRMLHTQLQCGMITNVICFHNGSHSHFATFASGNIVSIRDVVFFYKSAVAELHERVDSKYKDLHAHYKGGVNLFFH